MQPNDIKSMQDTIIGYGEDIDKYKEELKELRKASFDIVERTNEYDTIIELRKELVETNKKLRQKL